MSSLDTEFVAGTVRDGFHDVHESIRKLIRDLTPEALNWKPHPDANSLAVLVTHTLGSEREMIAAVAGVTIPRDRPSEFRAEAGADELLKQLDQADAWLAEHVSKLSVDDLAEPRVRGDRPPRPGLVWLVTNYGHAREHLAQMELTKQLYDAGR